MSTGTEGTQLSLGAQVKALISALREKIAKLTEDLAAAKKELSDVRGSVVTPRKAKGKAAGKGGKKAPTLPGV